LLLSATVVLALTAAAGDSDDVSWIRRDGTPGWRTSIPRETHPAGVVPSSLAAPTWFAKFPDARIPIASGGNFTFASARGKVLLLDYWASWCVPCLKELPHLQKLHEARSKDGLVAVAVNADEGAAVAADSAKRLGLTMTIGLHETELYRALGVQALPTVLIFDRQGRLRARWDGYRTGLETEIAATVDKLLTNEAEGASREVASVLSGAGLLQGRWVRDVPGTADGVAGMPKGLAAGLRVVASGGGQLVSFDAEGEAIARLKISGVLGRLLDFGANAEGTHELAGYRPGGTAIGVVAVYSGEEREIAVPAPLIDVAVQFGAPGSARRLVAATLRGAASAVANDARATVLEGGADVRSVAAIPGRGVLALRQDGTVRSLESPATAWGHPVDGSAHLLAAREDGVAVAPRTVIAGVSGRFVAGAGRQIALATYAGHVVILDEASGRILFDALWPDVHDLAATDLDGDDLDELLVAAGRSITALGAAAH
jgi:thiol-disulfide isomerase/thioredoxin